MSENRTPLELPYRNRADDAGDRGQRVFVALLLAAPGAACWGIYLAMEIMGTRIPERLGDFFGGVFWPLWFVAVVSAIASIVAYGRPPYRGKPWYAGLNLAINVSGLIFSAVAILPNL